MNFVVPVPSETFDVVLEDGASIRVRRHGNRDGVRLTVTHGNGFASDAYLPFWQQLTPHYDVLVFDFRNHGQNVPVEPANHNYAQLSRDLERVRDAIDSRLGQKTMLFITSVRYWINFVHTAKYKIKPHAIAIDTSQIAILPSLGTCP
jgi:pimeloyl-ACP methyl ester carboxylesterase